MNTAFGKTLEDIGGDIASVVSSNFSQMAGAVTSGLAKSIWNNPVQSMQTAGQIMFPMMAVLGGFHLGITKLGKMLEHKTFGQHAMQYEDKIFGSHTYAPWEAIGKQKTKAEEAAAKRAAKKAGEEPHSGFQKTHLEDDEKFMNVMSNDVNKANRILTKKDSVTALKSSAEIREKNAISLSNHIKTATEKDATPSGIFFHDDSMFPGEKKDSMAFKERGQITRKLHADALGLSPEDAEEYIKTNILSNDTIRKGEGYKQFTKEGTTFGKLISTGDVNAHEIATNIYRKKVGDASQAHINNIYAESGSTPETFKAALLESKINTKGIVGTTEQVPLSNDTLSMLNGEIKSPQTNIKALMQEAMQEKSLESLRNL